MFEHPKISSKFLKTEKSRKKKQDAPKILTYLTVYQFVDYFAGVSVRVMNSIRYTY